MDISEEEYFAKSLIQQAKSLNPKIGFFIERITPPLSGDLVVRLHNGTIKIDRLVLAEFKRSGRKTPKSFIEEVAWSFEPL